MQFYDLTLPTPAENLACDEVLLELCEQGAGVESLRLWQPALHFVVLGYANQSAFEVNLEFCRAASIPVLRRCTGGGTVLQGPGVLNYSLILGIPSSGPLCAIQTTNQFVLGRHQVALATLLRQEVQIQGQTDLTIGGLKFSGNAQRRRKNFLLFHGSFLLGLDISLVEQTLPMPSRRPAYRDDRRHSDFLRNLELRSDLLAEVLVQAWNATDPSPPAPSDRISLLARERYSSDAWNFRL